jgi:DNA repair protein RecO (recombination protein O)
MASEKTLAIVLRVTEFSETSCIVSVMTREFGRLTVMAKGARRPKSPFEAAIDVLAICRIVFIHKTAAMSLLTEAKLERRFRSAETDLHRLYAGYYVVELLRTLTDEGDPNPELFDLTHDMLLQMDQSDLSGDELNLRLLQYELGMLDLIGHLPMLTRCVSCGREKTLTTDTNFGLNAGGVLCKSCRRGQPNVVTISQPGFEFLLDLVGGQIGENESNSDNWNNIDRVNEQRLRNASWTPAAVTKNTQAMQLSLLEKNNIQTEPAPRPQRTNEVFYNEETANPVKVETVDKQNNVLAKDGQAGLAEARQLINNYITHLIGYPPRLHPFLNQI